jgi:hypothetical protein
MEARLRSNFHLLKKHAAVGSQALSYVAAGLCFEPNPVKGNSAYVSK